MLLQREQRIPAIILIRSGVCLFTMNQSKKDIRKTESAQFGMRNFLEKIDSNSFLHRSIKIKNRSCNFTYPC